MTENMEVDLAVFETILSAIIEERKRWSAPQKSCKPPHIFPLPSPPWGVVSGKQPITASHESCRQLCSFLAREKSCLEHHKNSCKMLMGAESFNQHSR